MRPSARETRDRILTTAYGLFYKAGFGRVSVDAVAAAAGVTKRTLYNHFDSKDALVAAVLDRQQAEALDRIRGWGDTGARSPGDLLTAIFDNIESWASQRRWLGSGYTRLTMELADLPGHPARRAARQHKRAVEGWLAEELARLGARTPGVLARETMLLIEGCMALILIHGDTGYATDAKRAALHLAAPKR